MQVATIERLSGRWDRVSDGQSVLTEEHEESALQEATAAIFTLDTTAPLGLSTAIEKTSESKVSKNHSEVEAFLRAHRENFSCTLEDICKLSLLIVSPHRSFSLELEKEPKALFRTTPQTVNIRLFGDMREASAFSAVGTFLIERRLTELLSWASEELEKETFHPLFIAGVWYLCFLQISPFHTANHRLAALTTWRMLIDSGYPFLRYEHFASGLADDLEGYYGALRQAERTAGSDWSTLNAWLEFFLDAVLEAALSLSVEQEKKFEQFRLTSVQQQILGIVKDSGSMTRDGIAKRSGINPSTIKYNLSVLTQQGMLKRQGAGRTTSYVAL